MFFREEKHFDWLRSVLLPQWRLCHNESETFRAWSAASSSGEEPFTLAIVLAEFFGLDGKWTIDATDISTRILAKAEAGRLRRGKTRAGSAGTAAPLFSAWCRPMAGQLSCPRRIARSRPLPAFESAPAAISLQPAVPTDFLPQRDDLLRPAHAGNADWKTDGATGTRRASARGPFGKFERRPSFTAAIAARHLFQARRTVKSGERTPLACDFRRPTGNLVQPIYAAGPARESVERWFGRAAQTCTLAARAPNFRIQVQLKPPSKAGASPIAPARSRPG